MDTWSQPLLRACQGRTRLLALPNRNIPPLRAVALCVGHPHIPVSEQRPRTHLESTLAQRLSRELRAKGTTRGEYEQRRYAHRQRARLTLPHSACVAIASRCAHRAGSAQPPPAIGGVYVRGHPSMTHLWQIASQHAVVERRAAAFWRALLAHSSIAMRQLLERLERLRPGFTRGGTLSLPPPHSATHTPWHLRPTCPSEQGVKALGWAEPAVRSPAGVFTTLVSASAR